MKINKILLIALLLLMLFVNTGCITVVDDGEVAVKKVWGNFNNEEITTGLKIYNPITTTIYKVNTKKSILEESVSIPSKEGLVVDVDISVIYRVKSNRASEIMQTVSGDILNTLLKPYVRNGLRDVASGYEAKAIYSEVGRAEITNKLQLMLEGKLEENLIIEDVLLRDVRLPAKVKAAIENKIDAEQKAQAKEFDLLAAEKDAEIEVARAKGVAEANKIISNSITTQYIQYKFIEGLNDGNTEVIYVPTEGNIPVMEASRNVRVE